MKPASSSTASTLAKMLRGPPVEASVATTKVRATVIAYSHQPGQAVQVFPGNQRLEYIPMNPDPRHRNVVEGGRGEILQQFVDRADQHHSVLETV